MFIEAESYQDGEWTPWIRTLYKEGNDYASITGGWKGYPIKYTPSSTGNPTTPTVTKNSDRIVFNLSNGSFKLGAVKMENRINISAGSTLVFRLTANNGGSLIDFRVWTVMGEYVDSNIVAGGSIKNSTNKEFSVEITESGLYDIGFVFNTGNSAGTCTVTLHELKVIG